MTDGHALRTVAGCVTAATGPPASCSNTNAHPYAAEPRPVNFFCCIHLRFLDSMSLRLLLQLNLTGSADAASDRMDRSTPRSSKADANTADAGAAAANADATNQAAAAAAVPPAEPPAGGYPAPTLQHLVLVAGHAVYTGVDYALAAKETSWFLEPYQQVSLLRRTLLSAMPSDESNSIFAQLQLLTYTAAAAHLSATRTCAT